MEKKYVLLDIKTKSVDTDKATIEAIFSSSAEDRHGDIVEQKWDLKNFKKNPVILNSHAYSDASEVIGKAINPKVKDGKLEGKIEFAVKENPKAKVIFDLYAGGFLNAFSVGFIPKKFDDKGKILESELLEVSAVSVPSNAEALAKKKGIEVEKLYDIKNKKSDGETPQDEDDSDQEERGEIEGDAREDEGNGGVEEKGQKENKTKSAEENGKIEDWYEGEGRIIYRERSLSEFEDGMAKIEVKPTSPKVIANVGVLKGDSQRDKIVQSYIFPREEGWTIDDSKRWVSTKDYSSLYLGKNTNDLIKKAIEAENNQKTKCLNKIYRALELTTKELGKEELNSIQRQANRRLVNKAVKKLLELKD